MRVKLTNQLIPSGISVSPWQTQRTRRKEPG